MRRSSSLDEIKASWKAALPDHDSTPSLSALAIVRLEALVARQQQRALADAGIHFSGFEVMAALHRRNDPRGLTLSELAQMMAVTPASITNRVDHLVTKGLIERIGSEADRRVGFVKLTKQGQKLVAKLLPDVLTAEAQLFKGLKKGERKDLFKLLSKLLESLESGSTAADED